MTALRSYLNIQATAGRWQEWNAQAETLSATGSPDAQLRRSRTTRCRAANGSLVLGARSVAIIVDEGNWHAGDAASLDLTAGARAASAGLGTLQFLFSAGIGEVPDENTIAVRRAWETDPAD